MRSVVGVCVVCMVVACGPGLPRKAKLVPSSTEDFVTAVRSHDAKAIEAQLDAPLVYAGLYFDDPTCAQQFPAPRKLDRPALPAFAHCLATLQLAPSTRTDAMWGVAVLEYAPGIELEAVFRFSGRTGRLAWIGYSGRRDLRDGLPTITPAALEVHRLEGDPHAAPTVEEARAIEAESQALAVPYAYAWLKVCLDTEGNVTGVHAREVTSTRAADAFTAAIGRWKFSPFLFGRQALPVCALVRLAHPHDKVEAAEELPIAFTTDDGAVRIPPRLASLLRRAGTTLIAPDDADKLSLHQAHGARVTAAYKYCFDAKGDVTTVAALEPSGLPGYDRKIARGIAGWKFKPYVLDGVATPACSAVTFIYSQR